MRTKTMPAATRKSTLVVHDCGLAEYRQVLQLQQQLHRQRRLGEIPNTVLLVEHLPVITLGARRSTNKLLVDRETLAQRQIDVVETRRGGGATAHEPGQLVFYPIIYLPDFGRGISEFIHELEVIGAELLERLGLAAGRRKGFVGLWVGERKIASIGARVSKLVTYHGMAININNDLSVFDLLVPCGLEGVEMTSVLKETGTTKAMSRAKQILADLLAEHFG